jgi:hypothetical protein
VKKNEGAMTVRSTKTCLWNASYMRSTGLSRTAHKTHKGDVMKKLIAVLAFCLAVGGASFGAEHVVTHSAKVAAKGTYKATKATVKGTGKALKFML